MDGPAVVAVYHDLYQVERSLPDDQIRSGRPARVSPPRRQHPGSPDHRVRRPGRLREAQARAGLSINRVLKVLRPLRSATVTIGAQQVTVQPRIPTEARTLLNDLGWSGQTPTCLSQRPPHVKAAGINPHNAP